MHGFGFGIVNILIGLTIKSAALSIRLKRIACFLSILGGLFVPAALTLRGFGVESALILGFTGNAIVIPSFIIMFIGYVRKCNIENE